MISAKKQISQTGSESILFAHKAFNLLDQNLVDDAVSLCEAGVKRFPFYATGHYILGRCYQAKERYVDARREYDRALFYEPGHIKAQKALAYIFFKLQLKEKARDQLMTTALYDPINKELKNFLQSEKLYEKIYFESHDKDEPQVNGQDLAQSLGDINEEEEMEKRQAQDEAYNNMQEDLLDLNQDDEEVPLETKGKEKSYNGKISQEDFSDKEEESVDNDEPNHDDFDLNNIIDNISEEGGQQEAIDLNQFDNRADDFSTIIGELFEEEKKKKQAGENEISEEEPTDSEVKTMFIHEEQESEVQIQDNEAFEEEEEEEDFILNDDVTDHEEADEQKDEEDLNIPAEKDVSINMPDQEPVEPVIQEDTTSDDDSLDDVIRRLDDKSGNKKSKEKNNDSVLENVQKMNELAGEEEDIEDILSKPNLLTTTFGEILIAQRRFSDALRVFETLQERTDDPTKYKRKIDFLKKMAHLDK
ncbi:MAG: tetratricopeptide repeat protein [Caldithrix sp.]|nr:tetratricopeptide repeat protein [Caldithrix sp.]